MTSLNFLQFFFLGLFVSSNSRCKFKDKLSRRDFLLLLVNIFLILWACVMVTAVTLWPTLYVNNFVLSIALHLIGAINN